MRSIRLKNFRSLLDTQRIELRPITLLVGANSSGKSSFLRFFPLLRQTVETPSQSPLLWYTDPGYVDFGDFSQAVRRGAEPRGIAIEMELGILRTGFVVPEEFTISLSITLQAPEEKVQVTECVVRANDDACRLVFDPSGAITDFDSNGLDIIAQDPSWQGTREGFHLVPTFTFGHELEQFGSLPDDLPGFRQLLEEVLPEMRGKTTDQTARKLIGSLYYGTGNSIKSELRSLQTSPGWNQRIDDMDPVGPSFRRIQSLLLAMSMPDFLRTIRGGLDRYAKGIRYLGPFRVAPERFYRQQALAVQQIEPHGENLAMFLRALPDRELQDASRFVHEHLGFSLRLRAEGSHVSILIEEDNGEAFNLIDMGYGFSQVLPVVVQAWATAHGFRSSERDAPTTLLAMEQPELHLHPHHQARLADMLTGVVNASRAASKEGGIPILVETHSEALVNRLGELVEAGQFAADDISVLLFEKDPKSGITTVRQSRYAADGTLENWPIGFFAP